MQPMSAQDEQNEELEKGNFKLAPKREMQSLLQNSSGPSSSAASSNPLGTLIARHHLTHEQAIEELVAFGF